MSTRGAPAADQYLDQAAEGTDGSDTEGADIDAENSQDRAFIVSSSQEDLEPGLPPFDAEVE